MADIETKIRLAALVRGGMYDTSRTSRGVPYFVQNEQGKTVPNPSLVRNRQVKTDGYFIESPNGNFLNGPIWSISIPAGLSVTSYPDSTLFPNPDKQKFSSVSSLGRQVRRFFDAAVSLIESGQYQYGPSSTLIPVEQNLTISISHTVEQPQLDLKEVAVLVG